MKIIRVKKIIETYKTKCERCDKDIYGTSEKMLKHNFSMHDHYCKKKENKK